MATEAKLCPDRNLIVHTQTQTMNLFSEFEGHVLIHYLASDGAVLGTSSEQVFWVIGTWSGGVSDRLDVWTDVLDASILPRVSSLKVVHFAKKNLCYWCWEPLKKVELFAK
jgi:hypothetical protein